MRKFLRPIGSQSVSQRPRTINSDSRRGGGRGQMSSHNNSSPAVNDPRQPSTANPYVAPMVRPEDLPVDYSGFIAVIFAIVGLMFRVRALNFCVCVFFFSVYFHTKNHTQVLSRSVQYESRFPVFSLRCCLVGFLEILIFWI